MSSGYSQTASRHFATKSRPYLKRTFFEHRFSSQTAYRIQHRNPNDQQEPKTETALPGLLFRDSNKTSGMAILAMIHGQDARATIRFVRVF
ncbi:MAG: hypothetical protein J7K65_06195 [Planctomycetes bacterium]|nr:hypothetical protein [Planctomycetota bacterium]